ncbi:MAG: winged helix-turn-helix transcriptional regulator, partial [Pseudomonadales bacterium]
KWSLVILRDLHCAKRTYSELASSPEGIPSNRLAERLKMLEREQLITRSLYSERPKRYHYLLTAKGEDVLPILQAMARWGNKYVEGSWQAPDAFMQKVPQHSKSEKKSEPSAKSAV